MSIILYPNAPMSLLILYIKGNCGYYIKLYIHSSYKMVLLLRSIVTSSSEVPTLLFLFFLKVPRYLLSLPQSLSRLYRIGSFVLFSKLTGSLRTRSKRGSGEEDAVESFREERKTWVLRRSSRESQMNLTDEVGRWVHRYLGT